MFWLAGGGDLCISVGVRERRSLRERRLFSLFSRLTPAPCPPVRNACERLVKCEEPGDVLLFLTGEVEIEDACRAIKAEVEKSLDTQV